MNHNIFHKITQISSDDKIQSMTTCVSRHSHLLFQIERCYKVTKMHCGEITLDFRIPPHLLACELRPKFIWILLQFNQNLQYLYLFLQKFT